MKTSNATDWRSDHLSVFAWKAALEEEVPPKIRKKIQVIFWSRRGKTNLQSSISIRPHTSIIEIGVPPQVVDKDHLAQVLCYGMACMKRYAATQYIIAPDMPAKRTWSASLPLEKTPQKPVSASQVREHRLTNARKMVVVWGRKAKMSDTILRKWQRRVKFYETIIASPPKLMVARTPYHQKLHAAIAAHDGAEA